MLVARITRRSRPAAGPLSCASASSDPCSSTTSAPGTAARTSGSARRISGAPGRKHSTLPSVRESSAAHGQARPACSGEYSIVSACVRPSHGDGGAAAEKGRHAVRPRASPTSRRVRRSPRARHACRASASPRSAWMLRSWNSSSTTVRKSDNSGSCCRRAVRIPSVATSSRVRGVNRRSNRMCQPTSCPSVQPRSSAMRRAIGSSRHTTWLQQDDRAVVYQRRRDTRGLAGPGRGRDHDRAVRAHRVADAVEVIVDGKWRSHLSVVRGLL